MLPPREKIMIKAVFFDIDGTLVPWKSGRIPASVFESVAALRRKGILCFVATGRSPFEISAGHLIDGLDFDGYLLNNGELGVDADGTVFYRCPVDPDDLARLLDWVEARGLSCWMVSEKQCAINRLTPAAAQALEDIRTQPPKLGDLRALCREPVYKFSLFLPPDELPMELLPHCAKTQWHAFGHDLFSAAGGKAAGLRGDAGALRPDAGTVHGLRRFGQRHRLADCGRYRRCDGGRDGRRAGGCGFCHSRLRGGRHPLCAGIFFCTVINILDQGMVVFSPAQLCCTGGNG